jgi:hypothetical protein
MGEYTICEDITEVYSSQRKNWFKGHGERMSLVL